MIKMPKVSIIIPNYNHSGYLEARLNSILDQTYKDYEIIILDDCSTDNSKEIIEKYTKKTKKISKVIYNEKNSGSTFKQWNRGFENTTGEYIWIAESDDWCENNLLEELITNMITNPEIVIGYVQSSIINQDNREIYRSKYEYDKNVLNGGEFVCNHMINGNAIFNASMAIFKKKILNSITKEYTKYKFCGDWIFWIEVALLGKVYISNKCLNYFRKHEGDVSKKFYSSGNNFIEEIDMITYLKRNKIINYKDYYRNIYAKYINYRNLLNESNIGPIYEIEKKFFPYKYYLGIRYWLMKNL
nr:glycosyltransferase family 2 protein [uncultured Arsenicibacter sp.]